MAPAKTTLAQMKEAVDAINTHRGNQVKAALSLRLSRQALQNRLHLAKERGLKIAPKPTAPIPEPVKPFAAQNAPPPSYTGGHTVEIVSNKDNTFLFGAAGDLHAASKYTRWDVREELYQWFENEGALCNFDTGNWIDGDANFNRYDLEVSGLDRQIKLLAKRHPRNIPTYAIWGDDHEGWYVQREGVDVGAYAEHVMRENGHRWTNLGFMEASVALKNKNSGKMATMAVVHPGGGSAYAISYSIQKIIESLDGGEKPAIGIYGHYHKLWSGLIRNVWVAQTGCFLATTSIETETGPKKIKAIEVGDMVLTHKGRYRKVVRTFRRHHSGEFISINYGRVGRSDQTITATSEHPILIERDGVRAWVAFADVQETDHIFVLGAKCPVTQETIPYWMALSKNANPMDKPEVRQKLSKTKGDLRKSGRQMVMEMSHLNNDIIPFCEVMREQGWQIVPTGAGVIPDAIGFKDGKVVAFEVESHKGNLLAFKQAKYEGAHISKFIDRVQWVDISAPRQIQPRSWYEVDEETGFVKVKVLSVKSNPVRGAHDRKKVMVYNFEVEEDNSYVAGRTVVHNCQQDQTPFMRKKRLEAHVGGCLIKLTQDPRTGAIIRMQCEIARYFNRGYYSGRWSKHGDVVLPKRTKW